MMKERLKWVFGGLLLWQGTIWGLSVMVHFWDLANLVELYPIFRMPYIMTYSALLVFGSVFGIIMILTGIFSDDWNL